MSPLRRAADLVGGFAQVAKAIFASRPDSAFRSVGKRVFWPQGKALVALAFAVTARAGKGAGQPGVSPVRRARRWRSPNLAIGEVQFVRQLKQMWRDVRISL